jgi:hypothetical protein
VWLLSVPAWAALLLHSMTGLICIHHHGRDTSLRTAALLLPWRSRDYPIRERRCGGGLYQSRSS